MGTSDYCRSGDNRIGGAVNIQQFDYSVNLLQALIWQYDDAENLQSLLTQKQEWYNEFQSEFWQDWYDNVFNLVTANEFGLAVWAIILQLPLQFGEDPTALRPIYGYGPNGNGNQNYTHGNYYDPNAPEALTLEEKRFLLRLRYFQLITRGAIPEINAFLKYLIPSISPTGTAYVLDGLDMTITYVFTFAIDPKLIDIFGVFDILPRPAGVKLNILHPVLQPIFGFGPDSGPWNNHNQNFENGNFINQEPQDVYGYGPNGNGNQNYAHGTYQEPT